MKSNGGIMKQALFSIALMVGFGLISGNAIAATRTWDGGGNANNSGSWQTNANWTGPDLKPGSGDVADLGDVTGGTRTVTNEAAETISYLTMTQNSVAGTNKLLLNANLSVASQGAGNAPYIQTLGTAVGNMVVNLNGNTLFTTISGWKNHQLRGTWDMSTPGSAIISQNGSDAMTVYGRLIMGSNTAITIARNVSFDYFDNYGTVNFQGNGIATIGATAAGATGLYFNWGTFTVGNGTDTPTARLRNGSIVLSNAVSGVMTVNSGATLALYNDAADFTTFSTKLWNSGSFNLAGKLVFRPNQWNLGVPPYTGNDIDNFGTCTVVGVSASIERQAAYAAPGTYFRFGNNAGATLTGTGKVTYANTTGQTTLDVCWLNNAGTIAPTTGGGLTLQGLVITNTGAINLSNSALTMANGSLNNAGGTVAIQNGGLLEANTFTQPSGTMTNSGGIYQFSTVTPTLSRTTVDTIVLTNGTISFRAVTNADVFANWPGGNQITNILYQGVNVFRLNAASNTAAKSQTYTFASNLGATNYARLELLNGSLYRGSNVTIGSGGSLLVSNGVSTIGGALSFASDATLNVDISTTNGFSCLVAQTNVNLNGCTLNVNVGPAPVIGTPFMIISNTSAGATSGQFANGTRWVTPTINGTNYVVMINTADGSGNDVVLTTRVQTRGARVIFQ